MADVQSEFFLAGNDDSGEGLAAALDYEVPESGDYGLIVTGALSSFGFETSGNYRLLVGLDAPEVLTGNATSTGDTIAVLDREVTPFRNRVEALSGEVTVEVDEVRYDLAPVRQGDTLYVRVEPTTDGFVPAVYLYNFANKPVAAANLGGSSAVATLAYTVDEATSGFGLGVRGCCGDEPSTGEFRLLIGTNAPDVLTGEAVPNDGNVVEKPREVQIGVKLQQLIDINEAIEFYTVVIAMQMEWDDPDAAFSPDECNCMRKVFTESNFGDFLAEVGSWPEFTIFNQQGRRFTQNQIGVIDSDGHVTYFERFTTDLQVDFDFSRYPFDHQEFSFIVDNVYSSDVFVYKELPGFTLIAEENGEDEFVITDWQTEISDVQASTMNTVSRFKFSFDAPRQLEYYALQIFIPILLIIVVSYVTFFLRDYSRRIEVASANLLLFIAFSFSLADNYPRLGYVTLLDALMSMIFVINALVVIYNVWLRKMEMAGNAAKSERIDTVLDWVYPIAYLAAFFGLYLWFFVVH